MNNEQFYKYFEIDPVCYLSQCSYENLARTGIEFGTDVCDYVDEENFKCKNCSLSTPNIEWYPPLTNEVYLRMVLAMLPSTAMSEFYLNYYVDIHEQIRNTVIKHAEEDELVKTKIQQILLVHCSEYKRN